MNEIEFPPKDSIQLRISGGGIARFMEFFESAVSRWVKVETLQYYDEAGSPGFDAFLLGDLAQTAPLAREMVLSQDDVYGHANEVSLEMVRVRVVADDLLSDYLDKYERFCYLADIEMNEQIFVIQESSFVELGGGGVGDFLLFDDKLQVSLVYDRSSGKLQSALSSSDPSTVNTYNEFADALIRNSTSFDKSSIFWPST